MASSEQNVNASSLAAANAAPICPPPPTVSGSQFSDTIQGECRHPPHGLRRRSLSAYRTCTSSVLSCIHTPPGLARVPLWLCFHSASYRETCNKPHFKLSWGTAIKGILATGLRQVGEERCICVGKSSKESEVRVCVLAYVRVQEMHLIFQVLLPFTFCFLLFLPACSYC